MELKTLYTREDSNAGAEIQIRDPRTGEETDFFIKVVGTSSDKWTEVKRSIRIAATIDGEAPFMSEAEMLAEVVLDWRGLVDNGEPVLFTKEVAAQLFIESPEVFEQVNRFVGDSANFTNPSKEGSSSGPTGTSGLTDLKKVRKNQG